jgi:hypothetical protein
MQLFERRKKADSKTVPSQTVAIFERLFENNKQLLKK